MKTKNAIIICAQFLFLLLFSSFSAQAAGEVDNTFNAYLANVPSGRVYRSVVQPDGKIIAAGKFTVVAGAIRENIVRLNPDGTIDPTFQFTSILPNNGAERAIQEIVLQPDGKIIIVGEFSYPRNGIARLNQDGTPDNAFNNNMALNYFFNGYYVKITPDNKILVSCAKVAGSFLYRFLMRLNSDGSLDTEREMRAERFDIQPDGKAVIMNSANDSHIERLNQDLTNDNTFTPVIPDGLTDEIVVQPDGKILLGGHFTRINGSLLSHIARVNANGSVDTAFNIGTSGPNDRVFTVELLSNGKILIGGLFSSVNVLDRNRIAVLNGTDGSPDLSFVPATNYVEVNDLDLQADGRIIASGLAPSYAPHKHITRLNSDGSIDTPFQPAFGGFEKGSYVLVQPDDKILVGGIFNYSNGAVRKGLVRFNADGTLDTSFDPAISSGSIFDRLPNGKVVTVSGGNVVRLNIDGSLDITYQNVTNPSYIKALPDGKVLVATTAGTISRFITDGSQDMTFTSPMVSGTSINKINLQPDGKILVSGFFGQVNGTSRGSIARLNADGTLDASFNPPGGANNLIRDMDLQADGKILVGGDFTAINFDTNRKFAARLNSDGSLDTSFTPNVAGLVFAVKKQPDGKVLIGGQFNSVESVPRWRYARLNTNGSLDTTFMSTSGTGSDHVFDIDFQSDGKIIMVGDFTHINGQTHGGIVRLLNPPSSQRTLFDYDGDGKADISVFRPSENKWYVLRSFDSGVTQQVFAIAGDVPVPSDYDGDGKTDFAIFRPSTGDWWSLSSLNGAQVYAHWGTNGDIPRPSDFDGDGRTDYVVFRPSNSFWYRISSATGASSNAAFGLAGDKPVTGDFDGDGKSDKAIFRPSTGDWWYQSSINGAQLAVHWGISTDVPAPADFDGDGKTDFAVYRPSTGVWYILNSSNGSFTIMNFGIAEDKPVPADYDGDGKADIAVFRPSTGAWYVMRTTGGLWGAYWGISTDIPTPNAFVP